jgi:hypothetical protein
MDSRLERPARESVRDYRLNRIEELTLLLELPSRFAFRVSRWITSNSFVWRKEIGIHRSREADSGGASLYSPRASMARLYESRCMAAVREHTESLFADPQK